MAHVATIEAVRAAIDAALVFDVDFDIEQKALDAIRLTTAALVNGQQVDVSSVVQWDEKRQTWEVLQVFMGGSEMPIVRSSENGDRLTRSH